jgi:GNAT superfamily N-acetyltransferase
VDKLHAATNQVLPVHRAYTEAFIRTLIRNGQGLAVVAGEPPQGFLIATIGSASIAPSPVAIEHGWYGPGYGRELLERYEEWARAKGCFAMRMSTARPDDKAAGILTAEGFVMSEVAWAKVL